tara:strand:+ start:197 stop:439 length:243 start_codon:yes stop_codon:yes gene_type:complete
MKIKKNEPLSREYLLNRGTCCDNNCFNCPYKPKKTKMKKHPYYDSDRKKKTEEFAMKAIAFVMLGFFAMYIVTMISQIFV